MPASSEASGAPGTGLVAIARPSPLRLAGFLATVLGAALLGFGSLMTWVKVGVPGQPSLTETYVGLDLTEGKVALLAAAVLLIGLMALRGARTRTAQKAISAVLIVAGLAGLGAAAYVLTSAETRYQDASVDFVASAIAEQQHIPFEQARQLVVSRAGQLDVTKDLGLWLAVAGGVLATFGGVLDLLWALAPVETAEDRDPATEPAERTGA